MKGREFKDLMYGGMAKMLKAIANPYRLEVIEILSQGEKTVEGIVQSTGMSFANASQHLQVLKNNNILKSRKEGHYVYYSLVNEDFLTLFHQITKYALEEVAELGKVMNRQRLENHSHQAVSLDDLERMIQEGNVLLLDVRPETEYDSGHITGAISMPMNQILSRLKEISKDIEIVAYCRGPFCVFADEAVKLLAENGYRVKRLDEGYPEWKIRQLESNP